MSQKQTVTINGREYDAHTGLPVEAASDRASRQALRQQPSQPATTEPATAPPTRQSAAAATVHQKAQRSTTLNRKFTKKPQAAAPARPELTVHKGRRIDAVNAAPTRPSARPAKKSLDIMAATRPQQPADLQPTTHDEPARPHPIVTRAHQAQAAKRHTPAKALPSASVIKQAAINEALQNAPAHHAKQHRRPRSHRSRLAGIVFGCLALVLFGGYLTYLNVPNISVRVAAAQAGIDASYPGYQPDGYRLNGPVAYSDGRVQIKFAANTGETGFTLNQSKSSWDSSALLENYVKQRSKDDYSTSQEKGITIYSYQGDAAWVSGGILYTIDGNAPLSPDQIRKIATSV